MNDDRQAEAVRLAGKARSDRLNVENNLAAREIPWDTVCFHCQQAAEKLLKAVLARHGQEVPRTHNLLGLLERCRAAVVGADWEALYEPLSVLNGHSVGPRYDDPPFGQGEEEGREAYAALLPVWDSLMPLLTD